MELTQRDKKQESHASFSKQGSTTDLHSHGNLAWMLTVENSSQLQLVMPGLWWQPETLRLRDVPTCCGGESVFQSFPDIHNISYDTSGLASET